LKDNIVNRVSNSKLVTLDLEDLYPEGARISLDISNWLLEGVVLHEKDFREHLSTNDWSQYKNAYVALHCSTDAIIPGWAYILVSLQLSTVAKKVVVGTISDLETLIFSEIITHLDLSAYKDQPVIIKGCGHKPVPENAFILLVQKLRPIAKSIMYGEACSSVPLYKKGK
jgi:uncharacterized protein DUF2480